MNAFAWSITFTGKLDTDRLPFRFILDDTTGKKTLFVYGDTSLSSSKEIVDILSDVISGKILSRDISIETEDAIMFINMGSNFGKYQCTAIHWVSFNAMLEKLEQLDKNVVAVREAESNKHGKRVIKVDTITP